MHNPARLAAYFRDYMAQHDLTTERAMAEQAGVSQGTINKILNQKSVRARTVDAIIDNLKLDKHTVYVATGMLPAKNNRHAPNGAPPPDLIDRLILEGLKALSDDGKQKALEYITSLLNEM